MKIAWVKRGEGFVANVGPFAALVHPKGDGRWNWSVFEDGKDNAMATGIGRSANGAKTVVEQLLARTGKT